MGTRRRLGTALTRRGKGRVRVATTLPDVRMRFGLWTRTPSGESDAGANVGALSEISDECGDQWAINE
jgi:hypothetical protein